MIERHSNQLSRRAFAESTAAGLAFGSLGKAAGAQLPSSAASSSDDKAAPAARHLTIGCLVFPRQVISVF